VARDDRVRYLAVASAIVVLAAALRFWGIELGSACRT